MSDIDGGDSGKPTLVVAKCVEDSVRRKIKGLDLASIKTFQPNIIKVRADVRKGHDDAYEPKMFFIGPYHRKKDVPSPMEQIKLLYVQELLSRDEERNKLSNYVAAIIKDEKKTIQQYSDDVDLMKTKEFVEMLLIDGCFLIELLLKHAEGYVSPPLSAGHISNLNTLRRDLLLLENQIPFFILQSFLELSNYDLPKCPDATLIDLVLNYLHGNNIKKHMLIEKYQKEENIYHILHLSYVVLMEGLAPQQHHPTTDPSPCFSALTKILKRSVRSIRNYVSLSVIFFLYCILHAVVLLILWRSPNWSVSSKKSLKKLITMIPTATELKEAGVTILKKKNKNKNKNECYIDLDVSFDEEGNFEIPLLSIQESTNSTFRNFLALEQSCPQVGNNFTSYVVLMDNLIDTPSDVAILKRRGILESMLGSDDDVARLFNQMRSGLCFDFEKHYLAETFERVNNYCNKEHNRWRAKLMHDYFSNPWALISLVGAVVLLLLTTLQTVYTIESFEGQK